VIRALLFGDSHLGFDLPFRPRITRRRRGPDFSLNFNRALQEAVDSDVDCIIHTGDLLYRSKVPAQLVEMAFEPILEIADRGIPVYIVPGNHERSAIPHSELSVHPRVYVFNRPRTFILEANGLSLALSGFPYQRTGIRDSFRRLLEATGRERASTDGHVLCLHHCFEGARVGSHNYTFRDGPDVIRTKDIPGNCSAVFSGHIHRFQVISRDLKGRNIPALFSTLVPSSVPHLQREARQKAISL